MTWIMRVRFAIFIAAIVAYFHVSQAQQKFPERAGEWEMKMNLPGPAESAQSMTTLFCLNDELWEKALKQNPSCKLQILSSTSKGTSYTFDCSSATYQITGKADLTYDGAEHIVGKATVQTTRSGKATSSATASDWRWKSPACGPNDVNTRPRPQH